ncbi:MAG: hypothetical protein JXQ72_11250 [Anaerolineae bacterium]|nr:hypothetical protein [Anaerolineae bacterium]
MPDHTPGDAAQLPAPLPAQLAVLEREHAELVASLPKHSVPAVTVIRLEDLEDTIAALRARIAAGEETAPGKD